MSSFVDGFCVQVGSQFSDEQIRIIKDQLEIYSMQYEIKPLTTEIVSAEYNLPKELILFLATKQQNGKMCKRSYEQYYDCLSKMLYDIRLPLDQITVNHIRMHIHHISKNQKTGDPLSNSTLDQRKSMIRSFFQFLYEEEYISKDPSVRIKPVRADIKPREAYTDIQIIKMHDACRNDRDRAIVDLLSSSGIRVAELAGLNRSDIDFDVREVKVYGKGGKYRTSFINAKAEVSLKKYLSCRCDENEALFVSLRKPYKRLSTYGVRKMLHTIEDKSATAGIIPHRFRHTVATQAVSNGMPIESVQAILGHSQITTTMRYAHISSDKVKRDHEMYMRG